MEDISVHHHDFFQFFLVSGFTFYKTLKRPQHTIKRGQFVFDNRTSTNEI